jgi:hypothetical protein
MKTLILLFVLASLSFSDLLTKEMISLNKDAYFKTLIQYSNQINAKTDRTDSLALATQAQVVQIRDELKWKLRIITFFVGLCAIGFLVLWFHTYIILKTLISYQQQNIVSRYK